ncbi:MAG TPA: adenylate/guanylate cyclase domain-containing protein [Methylomirabilota bacterium]|nr:adenylate/guanylate cyclase domain-containing protein [Methylomirabilota bacterium]
MSPGGWWRARRGRLLQLWAVGLVSSALVTAASALGYLEGWQARGLDLLLRLQGHRTPYDVVVIGIDDTAFDGVQRRQPIPRDYLARIVRGLQRSGAAAVGLDLTFATPTSPAEDAALARALLDFSDRGLSRVVVGGPTFPSSGPLGAPEVVRAVATASTGVPVEDDGVIRHIMLVVPPKRGPGAREPVRREPETGVPSLAVAVAARGAGLDPRALGPVWRGEAPLAVPRSRPGRALQPGAAEAVTLRPGALWPINYVGPTGIFLTLPSDVVAALADPQTEIAADNPLRGRLVLVGGTFPESRDFYYTPYGLMPGVEVHANVLHMLTTRRFIQPSSWALGFGVSAVAVLLASVVMLAMKPLVGTAVCAVGGFVLGVPAALLAFDRGGYWVDFLLPVLATSVMGLLTDVLARRRMRDQFGRYLSKDLLALVIDDAPSLRGERRVVSVLFSDLRGYTTLSETMTPEAIAAHLNEYFDAMRAAIFAHQGMINDFIGDAVMAVFGAPLSDPDHALHAVQAAAHMDRALAELNQKWTARGLPLFHMGIGIHTGSVFAGNVGGHDKIKYTVIGDPVNVGSRVEGLNKELGTTILITAETYAAVGDRVQVKDRGPMHVKGRVEEVRVYEVLSVEGGSR